MGVAVYNATIAEDVSYFVQITIQDRIPPPPPTAINVLATADAVASFDLKAFIAQTFINLRMVFSKVPQQPAWSKRQTRS